MILWVIAYPSSENIKESLMQTLGKIKNSGESTTQLCLAYCHLKDIGMPQRSGLFTLALAAALVLTTGCVRDDPATHRPPAQASSEVENPKQAVHHKHPPPHSELENTERNARDKGGATLTPQDQKENRSDINITAAIRRSVVKNKSLSLDAHNAKIITRDGVVTLRGPVKNASEKHKLQSLAEKTRGIKQVDNQLEPKTP
jgi:hypothetical protein